MSQYNFVQALYMSFYSPSLYRDVAERWGAKTFLYLLFLVALSWILVVFHLHFAIKEIYQKNANEIVHQIPIITIDNGEVKTPENRPYFVRNPQTMENIAVIDTSGKYTSLAHVQTGLLVTKNEVISQHEENETRIYQIPANMSMAIVPETISFYIQKYLWAIGVFFFVLLTIGAFIYRLIQGLIYALIGKLMSYLNHVPLSYDKILQITLVAITPTIVFATVFDYFHIIFPFRNLLYFILAMAYLYFGIISNKPTQSETPINPS